MEELNAEDDTVAGQDIADEGVERLSVINDDKKNAYYYFLYLFALFI